MYKDKRCAQYRNTKVNGHTSIFSFMYVWVRYSPTLYNKSSPAKDFAWLRHHFDSIGAALSPDGRTWGMVLCIKKPVFSSFMDIVTRKPEYGDAISRGDRPVFMFNNCAFIWNEYEQTAQLQTLHPQGNWI